MEHPMIGDLSQLSLEELSAKINELYKKLGIAQRGGNGHLSNQLRMALESYQTEYQKKLQASYRDNPGQDFGDRINIE
jgi:hypothetical protein